MQNLKLICQIHQTKKHNSIGFISFEDKEQANNFKCNHCLNESSSLNGMHIVNINEFLQQSEDLILNNWPPLNNEKTFEQKNEIRNKINNLLFTNDKLSSINDLSQKIETHVEKLQEEITQKLQDWKKSLLIQIGMLSDIQSQFVVLSNSLSQRDKVVQLLKEYDSDPSHTCQKMNLFILDIKQKAKENTQKLEKFIQGNEDILQSDLLNTVINKKKTINNLMNYIFDQKQQKSQQSSGSNRIGQEIYKLITNRFNFCSENFIQQIKQKIEQLDLIFCDVSLEEIYQGEDQTIKISNLNDKQMKDLNNLVNEMIKTQQQSKQGQDLISQYFIDTISQNKMNLQLNSLQQIINQLQNYPIFNSIQIDQSINWVISNYNYSQLDLEKGVKNINQPYIKRIKENGCIAVAYLNMILQPEIKYQIRLNIKFGYQNNKFIFIGLIRQNQRDISQLHMEELSFTTFSGFRNNYGVTKQIKGKHLSELIEENGLSEIEVELMIHIQTQTFIVYDYPNKQSIYSIKDNSNLKTYQNLYLAYESNAKNQLGQEISLINIKQVQEFDKLL